MEKKSRCGRITKIQKVKLLEMMRANKKVAMGNFGGPNSAKMANGVWEAVALELNATGGAKKSAEQWKKSWADWKCAVKKQQAQINKFRNRTGNLPASDGPVPLEDVDVDVLEFLPSAAVEGDGKTEESGFTQCETLNLKEEKDEEVVDISMDTPKRVPSPRASSSRSQTRTFSSSFEEIKKYVKEMDEKKMELMERQTQLLEDVLKVLKSLDDSLKPSALGN